MHLTEQPADLRRWIEAWRSASKVVEMETLPQLWCEPPVWSEAILAVHEVERNLNNAGLGMAAQQAWFARWPRASAAVN